jgi:hypothetical protein
MASNDVRFIVPGTAYITLQSGPSGTMVTIGGSGLGATHETGTVSIGGPPMAVLSWSDTQISAAVATGTTPGNVTVQRGSLATTGPTFTITLSYPYVNSLGLSLFVGQIRTGTVTDRNGNPVTGLQWITTNPAIVSLSTDNPPVVTAIASGVATGSP